MNEKLIRFIDSKLESLTRQREILIDRYSMANDAAYTLKCEYEGRIETLKEVRRFVVAETGR